MAGPGHTNAAATYRYTNPGAADGDADPHTDANRYAHPPSNIHAHASADCYADATADTYCGAKHRQVDPREDQQPEATLRTSAA